MPNRILKESICTSETIDSLPSHVEVFFYRLIVNCDDFGILDARPQIVRAKCFPLKDNVSNSDVSAWLLILARKKLIVLYEFEGQRYLKMSTWEKHQQVRATRSKYPQPNMEGAILVPTETPSPEINGNQLIPNAPVIQSNPIRNPNPNPSQKELPSDALRLSGLLASLILENNPSFRELQPDKKQKTLYRWGGELDSANRLDKRTWIELEEAIRWSQADEFWKQNILSGGKLREQYDRLKLKMNSKGSQFDSRPEYNDATTGAR